MKLNHIYQGNTLEVLKTFPDESIDCVITSPPYWALRDYGIESSIWDGTVDCQHKFPEDNIKRIRGDVKNFTNKPIVGSNANEYQSPTQNNGAFCSCCSAWRGSLGLEPTFDLYIKHLADIFDEIKRVLKNSGTCWVNLGDTYWGGGNNRGSTEENLSAKQFSNRGARGQAAREWTKDYPTKSLCQIPNRFSIEMTNRGWILRNKIIWYKPNCMPSSVKDRFTVDFEEIFFFVKNKKYWFERQFDPQSPDGRQVTTVKAKEHSQQHRNGERWPNPQGRNKRCVWKITTQPFKEAHFAVFPEDLVETPIKSGCPEFVCNKCGIPREKILTPTKEYSEFLGKGWHDHKADKSMGMGQQTRGFSKRKGKVDGIERYNLKGYTSCSCKAGFSGGVVLDPFMGSGTVAVVAKRLNRQYIGIELKAEYIKMAEKRINNTQRSLF